MSDDVDDDGDPLDEMIRLVMTRQAAAMKRGALSMWTLYHRPADFPHSYVARRSEVGRGGVPGPSNDILQIDDEPAGLAILRVVMARCGLTCLTRDPSDVPSIVEVWL